MKFYIIKNMNTKEMTDRICYALEIAADKGYITPQMGMDELGKLWYEILEFEFTENEIDQIPESLIKSVFKSWVA